jgi:hypothetical protein
MKYSRRKFIKSASLAFAGAAIFSNRIFAGVNPKPLWGFSFIRFGMI